jgi:hypothetical protein
MTINISSRGRRIDQNPWGTPETMMTVLKMTEHGQAIKCPHENQPVFKLRTWAANHQNTIDSVLAPTTRVGSPIASGTKFSGK